MASKQSLLGSHPEIDTFYRDVAGLKRGGKRTKKARARPSRQHLHQNQHMKNSITINIDKAHEPHKPKAPKAHHVAHTSHGPHLSNDPFQPKRAQYPMITLVTPPTVTIPSYYARSPNVGMWMDHSHLLGVDRQHPGHLKKTYEVNDPSSSVVQQQVNPSGIHQGVDGNRAIMEYTKQPTLQMDADGLQPHVSQSYFAPTGAPGNHPAPRAAVAAPIPAGYYPLQGQAAIPREEEELRAQHVAPIQPLPSGPPAPPKRPMKRSEIPGSGPAFPKLRASPVRDAALAAHEEALIDRVHQAVGHLAPGSHEAEAHLAALKRGGRYHAHSVFR